MQGKCGAFRRRKIYQTSEIGEAGQASDPKARHISLKQIKMEELLLTVLPYCIIILVHRLNNTIRREE